jgi:hypothetical protein
MKTRKTKALIKDLELQIDYLISYSPQGLHWKQEYHFRENLMSEVLESEQTPPDTITKINNIQEKIFEIKRKDAPHNQDYLNHVPEEERTSHKILVNHTSQGESYILEI